MFVYVDEMKKHCQPRHDPLALQAALVTSSEACAILLPTVKICDAFLEDSNVITQVCTVLYCLLDVFEVVC